MFVRMAAHLLLVPVPDWPAQKMNMSTEYAVAKANKPMPASSANT